MAKFISGTEWFRLIYKDVKTHFVKGTPFVAGKDFPLQEGLMAKDMNKIPNREEVSVFFYASKI